MDILFLGIVGPMIINFVLLFNRKKKWALSNYRWYFVLGMLVFSVLFTSLVDSKSLNGREKLAIWGLMTPTIFSLLDFSFKEISKLIHGRDIYLWLRGSNDIDDTSLSGGKHVRASDRILSILLLFSVIMLPFAISVIWSK